jgi:hypothetical protein
MGSTNGARVVTPLFSRRDPSVTTAMPTPLIATTTISSAIDRGSRHQRLRRVRVRLRLQISINSGSGEVLLIGFIEASSEKTSDGIEGKGNRSTHSD